MFAVTARKRVDLIIFSKERIQRMLPTNGHQPDQIVEDNSYLKQFQSRMIRSNLDNNCRGVVKIINLKIMECRRDLNDTYYMFLGKNRNAEEMLNLYIYNYMKKRNLQEAAKIFAEEANIEILNLVDDDVTLLKDWWDAFWPQFSSGIEKQPGGHPQSSAQPSLKEAMEMLASLNCSSRVDISQPPSSGSHVAGHPADSHRRAGKQPMNFQGQSSSKGKGKEPLGFPPAKLLPTDIAAGPHSSNLGHLQMPVTIQPPPHAVRAPRSVQLEPTYPVGEYSAYPPVAPNAGEDYWNNQVSLTGVGVSTPDGPDPNSFGTHLPDAYLELMQREVERLMQHSNPANRS